MRGKVVRRPERHCVIIMHPPPHVWHRDCRQPGTAALAQGVAGSCCACPPPVADASWWAVLVRRQFCLQSTLMRDFSYSMRIKSFDHHPCFLFSAVAPSLPCTKACRQPAAGCRAHTGVLFHSRALEVLDIRFSHRSSLILSVKHRAERRRPRQQRRLRVLLWLRRGAD